MTIYLAGATPVADNQVRLDFSEPFNQNSVLYDRNNYAFDVRYGERRMVYTKEVTLFSATAIILTLTDTLLKNGRYQVFAVGVSAISDGIRIELGAGPKSLLFDATAFGVPSPVFSIRKKLPAWYNTAYGSNLYGILGATGQAVAAFGDDQSTSSQSQAKAELALRTATGARLDTIANNYGAHRPPVLLSNDDLWRVIAPFYIMGRRPVLGVFYSMLQAVKDAFGGDFRVYTVNFGEIVIEMTPDFVLSGATPGPSYATYLHPDASVVGLPTPPGGYPGDYLVADPSVPGTAVDGHIVVLSSDQAFKNIFDPLRAAGITISLDVKEF